jgi:imidazolonepropionase-like amidohydrolase
MSDREADLRPEVTPVNIVGDWTAQGPRYRVIIGGAIIDVATGSARRADVHILDGRISAIVPPGSGAPLADAVIACPGAFVMPGLIDTHAHVVLDASGDPLAAFLADPGRHRSVATANLHRALLAGVTTVRDLGAPIEMIEAIQGDRATDDPVATLTWAGPPLTRLGGHLHYFGGEVASEADLPGYFDRLMECGASTLKLVVTGGGLTPGTRPGLTEIDDRVASSAVSMARSLGLKVVAHCHATSGMRLAVALGVDVIEHASFLGEDGEVSFDPDLARDIRDRGIHIGPTIVAATRTADRFRASGNAHNPADSRAIGRLMSRRSNTARLIELGVPIVAGSDSGVTDTPAGSVVDEVIEYTQIGMTAADAIRTATSVAARIIGRTDIGEIRVGSVADVVILDRNPLARIEALREPRLIVARGDVVAAPATAR